MKAQSKVVVYGRHSGRPNKHQAPKTTTDERMKYIKLHQTGLQVQIGKVASLYFSDSKWGSLKKALKAAMAYRDEVLPLYDLIPFSYRGNLSNARNNTGHIGVSREKNEAYTAYTAQWTNPDGTHGHKYFSIAKYGEEEAFRLAKEARAKNAGEYPAEVLAEIAKITEKYRR